MTKNLAEAETFLNTVFHAHDSGQMLIWTLPDKKSHFCKDTSQALDAIKNANGSDIYVGVGISKAALSPERRGDLSNIQALPALVLDLDVKADGMKKPAFESKEQALEFINTLPLRPTVVVDSGGGLHCWNVFNEPLEITDDTTRLDAMRLAKAWNIMAQRQAAKLGVVIDSVYDLTRVLRVPGTRNFKYGKPGKPVSLVEIAPDRLYNPDDFEIFATDINLADSTANVVEGLVLSPDRQPPGDKMAALLCNSKEFRETWERTRANMTDTSASAWDMALANMAAQAEWTEQEIADLLIANRIKHNEKLKIRETYINTTIQKALSQVKTEKKALASISSILSVIEGKKKSLFDPATLSEGSEEYQSAFSVLQNTLAIPVLKLTKYGRSLKATYSATFTSPDSIDKEDQTVITQTFSDVEEFESQRTWMNIASTIFMTDPIPLKKETWRKIVKIMRHVLSEVNSAEFNDQTQTFLWVHSFCGPSLPPQVDDAVDFNAPFIKNDLLHIRLPELSRFLRQTRTANISLQVLGTRLSTAGFRSLTVRLPNGGRGRFWTILATELFKVGGGRGGDGGEEGRRGGGDG